MIDVQQQSCCYNALDSILSTLFYKEAESPPRRHSRLRPVNCREDEMRNRQVRNTLFSSDLVELQSKIKRDAQQIQTKFERRFDENDYSQRYEKYGSRAHFIRDRRRDLLSC